MVDSKSKKNVRNMFGLPVVAHARQIKVSPRKLGLVAGLIRMLNVEEALAQLTFCKRRISGEVKKCLQSAIANAENNFSLDVNRLYVDEVLVGKAMVLKRMMPRARGRSTRIEKPFSNLSIIVKELEENE